MKEKGVDIFSPNFDWKTHEVDIDAGDFAQQQVDRQQNVSSSQLQGQVFNTKNLYARMGVKALLPFSNFLLNQKSRMYSDILTASNSSNTKEERATAMRSLAGLAVETAVFNSIGLTLTQMAAAASAKLSSEDLTPNGLVYVAWDDGLYYPARFVKYSRSSKYVVQFDDGDTFTVNSKDIKELIPVHKSQSPSNGGTITSEASST